MDDTLLPLNRAARRVGVTAKWLRGEAEAGRVPCLPTGTNRFLFDVNVLAVTLRERASTFCSQGVAHVQ